MGLSGPAGPDGAAPDAAAGPGAHTTAPGAAVPGAGPAAPGDAAHTRPDAGPPDLGRADAGARTGAAGEATGQLAASAPMTVRYTFEAGSARTMRDTGGHYQLRVVAAAGGSIAFLRRGNGWAARFPDRCTGPAAGCPRAILESSRPDLFNPGTRPIRYGAAVLMTRRDTAPGANVLQKGYSTDGGSQYKLQVDGAAGRPSCVVADARRTIYRVTSPVSVADGRR
ncbi:MAG TPA: hypothetical protein VNV66_06450 [Pilimelia sp.]|nr:hypothetical protein [Pilimelia sp.]